MVRTSSKPSDVKKCVYIDSCYLAEMLECFGYRADCALYRQSDSLISSHKSFPEALDRLIVKAKARCDFYGSCLGAKDKPNGK